MEGLYVPQNEFYTVELKALADEVNRDPVKRNKKNQQVKPVLDDGVQLISEVSLTRWPHS